MSLGQGRNINVFHTSLVGRTRPKVHFLSITKAFKYTENFTTKKEKFSDKNSDSFHISAQNIDCRYSLEPPQ